MLDLINKERAFVQTSSMPHFASIALKDQEKSKPGSFDSPLSYHTRIVRSLKTPGFRLTQTPSQFPNRRRQISTFSDFYSVYNPRPKTMQSKLDLLNNN